MTNSQGGKIYIGINDKGKSVGINNVKKLLKSLSRKIRDALGIVVNIN